jgi:hypothetical protein
MRFYVRLGLNWPARSGLRSRTRFGIRGGQEYCAPGAGAGHGLSVHSRRWVSWQETVRLVDLPPPPPLPPTPIPKFRPPRGAPPAAPRSAIRDLQGERRGV